MSGQPLAVRSPASPPASLDLSWLSLREAETVLLLLAGASTKARAGQ